MAGVISPFPAPELRPYKWRDEDEPAFDQAVHLAPFDVARLAASATTMDQIFSGAEPRFEVPPELRGRFGFSEPFRVLSDAGLSVACDVLRREKERGFVLPDVRIQLCLRGVSYRSPFLRGFSESPALKRLACDVTRENLVMHPMISNEPTSTGACPPMPAARSLRCVPLLFERSLLFHQVCMVACCACL